MDKYACGTCELMCPPREVQMRSKERLLHFFESNPPPSPLSRQQRIVCVTEFSRSAAGQRTPLPSDLRTPAALRRTVEYLVDRVLLDTRKPFWFVYEFVFNRLRCVRQEIVIQNLEHVDTIALLEPVVMFLAYSSYRLCESPVETFDPYVCNQHLQECLKKLLCCYDASHADERPHRNRHLFESLYLVFNLGKAEAISRGLTLSPAIRRTDGNMAQVCLGMSLRYYGRRFDRVLADMRRLPAILAGVAVLKLQVVRREMLATFAAAYHSKVLSVPVRWLGELLLYDSDKRLLADLKHYKCELSGDGGGVLLVRSAFDGQIEVIKPRQEAFVNNLYSDDSDLVDTLLLLKI